MRFARDLHPEFGYLGSAPRVFRKLGLVFSFVAFGIVAGASGVAVFMASGTSSRRTEKVESARRPRAAFPTTDTTGS